MISTILLVIFLLTAIVYAVSTRKKLPSQYNRSGSFLSFLAMPLLILIVGIIVSLIQPYSLKRIDMSSVGLKVNLTGNERGLSNYQYKTGWVTYNTWTESLYSFPTFLQHLEYDSLNVITKGGFSALIKPSFNYNLIPSAVGDMFLNLRVDVKQMEQGWLKTAIIGSI